MKAKITKIGPVGESMDSKEFYIPLIKKNKVQLIHLKDGTTIHGEPMLVGRYFLEIADYVYRIHRNGKLEKISGNDE